MKLDILEVLASKGLVIGSKIKQDDIVYTISQDNQGVFLKTESGFNNMMIYNLFQEFDIVER